jgi:hypothetical protein
MAAALAVVKREAELDKRETAWRASQRIARIKDQADEIAQKAKKKLDTVKDSNKAAVATNGVARTGGMALECYVRTKMDQKKVDSAGAVAVVGAIVGYTLGMQSSSPTEQLTAFTLAGAAEGFASRFLLKQFDSAFAG